mgnify:CR=1 FL=1
MAPKEVSLSVAEVIQNEIYYPDFAVEDKFQGKVVVEVQILEDGSFDVIGQCKVGQ